MLVHCYFQYNPNTNPAKIVPLSTNYCLYDNVYWSGIA